MPPLRASYDSSAAAIRYLLSCCRCSTHAFTTNRVIILLALPGFQGVGANGPATDDNAPPTADGSSGWAHTSPTQATDTRSGTSRISLSTRSVANPSGS